MAASHAVDVSAQRKPADRRLIERGRVAGRYDAGRAPLPPGNALATSPREENREALQKQLKRLRVAIRGQAAALKSATTAAARLKAMNASEYLEGEAARLQGTIAGMGDGLAVAGVVDPMGDGKATIRASVNRRTDILEVEHSAGRISDAAYRAGRTIQDVLEKVGRIGGSNLDMSRGDRATTQGNAVARAMEQAQDTRRMLGFIEGRLGMIDTRLVRRVIGDGMSYADCAALQGKAGERGVRYVAGRVRDALEELADTFGARGRLRPTPDDAYHSAAGAMWYRQDVALAGGVTLARLEADLADLEADGPAGPGTLRQAEIDDVRAAIAGLRLRQAEAAARGQG